MIPIIIIIIISGSCPVGSLTTHHHSVHDSDYNHLIPQVDKSNVEPSKGILFGISLQNSCLVLLNTAETDMHLESDSKQR